MKHVSVQDSVVLITGANRGIGKAFVEEALRRGAKKVYATARRKETLQNLVDLDAARVKALELDVTRADQIQKAASEASDVNILINNAGVAAMASFLGESNLEKARYEMEVNYFGALAVSQAFAATLEKNLPASVSIVSSVAGWVNFPSAASYSASKAAAHSLIQGLRGEFGLRNIFVQGIYPGPIDTDMAKDIKMEKETPLNVAKCVYAGLEEGIEDSFPDKYSQEFIANVRSDIKAVEKQLNAMLLTR